MLNLKPRYILAVTLAFAFQLSGCNSGGGAESGAGSVTHSGSVGDGPITGASVVIADNTGRVLVTEISDVNASYSAEVNVGKKSYPLQIYVSGGTDVVTQSSPDFSMFSVVTHPSQKQANVNPFSTLIYRIALAMPGELTESNLEAAANIVSSQFAFGLDSSTVPDPIRTTVNDANIAPIIRASEAFGETIRRARDTLVVLGNPISGDEIMHAIAADLVDGSLNGIGAPDSDPRTAAIVNITAGQVLIETMSNHLIVGGIDATQAMDSAVKVSIPDASSTSVMGNVPVTRGMIEQARRSVTAAQSIAPGSALSTIASILDSIPENALPTDIEPMLPSDTSQDLDNAISTSLFATDTQLNAVNNTPETNNTPPDNTAGSSTGADLVTTISAASSAVSGSNVKYSVAATNRSTTTAADQFILTHSLPAGVSLITSPGNCRNNGGIFTCTLNDLSAGNTINYSFTVQPTATGSYTIAADVNSSTTDPNPSNNSTTATVSVSSGSSGSGGATGSGSGSGGSGNGGTTPPDNQPFAYPDSATISTNQSVNIAVLANDSGIADTPVNVAIISSPSHGSAAVNTNNTATYSPDTGYAGTDSFSYRVRDSDGDVSIATVSISVACTSNCTVIPQSVSLAWNPTPGNVDGYIVYFGNSSGTATQEVSNVSGPSVTLDTGSDLQAGKGDTVCFRVSAYNNVEVSAPSDAICGVI